VPGLSLDVLESASKPSGVLGVLKGNNDEGERKRNGGVIRRTGREDGSVGGRKEIK